MTWGKLKRGTSSRSGTAVKRVRLLITLISIFMIAACVFAGAADRLQYAENFETGKVEISLQEVTGIRQDGTDDGKSLIAAGETLRYTPRIYNMGNDCFVRAQIHIDSNDGELPAGTEAYIYGMNSDWIRAGEYYYYKNILKDGEYADIIEGISVPENWTDDTADAVTVSVRAEAIQSANFEPDFAGSMPWGAVMLEAAAAGGNVYRARTVSSTSEVEFDSAGEFQCSTSDLFDSFESVMPGDWIEKTVTVRNRAADPLDLAMKINAEPSAVNEKMQLKVSCGDRIIFDGTAAEAYRKGQYSLGSMPRAGESVLSVTLELPPGTGNEYTELKDSVVWELMAEEADSDSVQTGDDADLKPFAAAAAAAILIMIILAVYKRKESK